MNAPVAPDILELLRAGGRRDISKSGNVVVLHLSATCGECLSAAQSLTAAYLNGSALSRKIIADTTCVLTGTGGNKASIVALDGIDLPLFEDPEASAIIRKLGLVVSPTAMVIDNGQVAGWTGMYSSAISRS